MNSVKFYTWCLLPLLTILLLPVCSTVGFAQVVVNFPDPGLEAAIGDAINKPSGDIYDSDLVGLIDLNASNRSISDLSGLDFALAWNRLI